MPPRGVKRPKLKRQYEHIKESYEKRGKSEDTAEEIAARTVNKERREMGLTKSSKKKSSAKKASSKKSSGKKSSSGRSAKRSSAKKSSSKGSSAKRSSSRKSSSKKSRK